MICPDCEGRYDTCPRCSGTGQVLDVAPDRAQAFKDFIASNVNQSGLFDVRFADTHELVARAQRVDQRQVAIQPWKGWDSAIARFPDVRLVFVNADTPLSPRRPQELKIVIYSWRGADLLEGQAYRHNQVLGGTEAEAVRIAGVLFASGFNVMVCRSDGEPGTIIVGVDNYRFQQR